MFFVDKAHDGWMFSGRCLRVRPYKSIDSLYLYYYFCLKETKQFVRNIAVGATMPSINTKLLGEVEITYPHISVQRKIVKILSAIDNKIELNKKVNDNLADLLQTIYQEQFGDVSSASAQGNLSDLCSYSRDRVPVSQLNTNTYFSTENMLPGKVGATEATSLPTTPQTTACHKGDTLISNIRPYFKKIVYVKTSVVVQLMFFASHLLDINMRLTYLARYMQTSFLPLWLQDQKELKCPVEISSKLCPIPLCFRLMRNLASSTTLHCPFSHRFNPIEMRISGFPQ